MTRPSGNLGFYVTPSHDCNYLSERQAITLFADPKFPKNKQIYSALTSVGFRRSGDHIYQPYCNGCSECISVRLDVNHFSPNKNQRRNWKMNQSLSITSFPAHFTQEHFHLYKKYIRTRHSGGGMEEHTPETFMEFLKCDWAETELIEFRLDGTLLSVAVIDYLDNAISAVYTFFDPEQAKRSLGRYAVLYEIELARSKNLQWLYLGYWIQNCQKMRYKNEYQPIEYYIDNEWRSQPKG